MVSTKVDLETGRDSYASGSWAKAFDALSRADEATWLGPADLELLARSAYMLGRNDAYRGGLERAHQLHLEAGEVARVVRCAFWIGHNFLFRGENVQATGWFARAQRMLTREDGDCVEHGYLLIPVWLKQMAGGDYESGYATAAEAAEIGERFRDADLTWLAVDEQARALVNQGRVEEGLRLVDEVLITASRGELSPVVTGIVYCKTIAFCQGVFELRHAREWTKALTRWCDDQRGMVAHNGLCLVHRAEVMQLQGAWTDALDEARHAAGRFRDGVLNELARGEAFYRQGEVHRLRGELGAAESAYREASRLGCEPQPGLALLRLAQGNDGAATGAIRRAVAETTAPLKRAVFLPAYVEIMLAAGAVDEADSACRELEQIAERQGSDALAAASGYARGAVALAAGDCAGALVALRGACHAWQELAVPYEAARARLLLGLACRSMDDHDSGDLELEAARQVFAELGAVTELAHVDSLIQRTSNAHGLTVRELEVLRLVAAGKSNRAIAEDLVISDHTVRRHLQNIFRKLGVSSRAAATAFAFQHGLT
jgi:DNA-binding CsgD family transcriptional regulator